MFYYEITVLVQLLVQNMTNNFIQSKKIFLIAPCSSIAPDSAEAIIRVRDVI